MIPILRLSEPFFYFIVICIAGLACVAALFGMRRENGRRPGSWATLLFSIAVIALIFYLSYHDLLVLPSDLRLNAALGLGLTIYFAAILRRLPGDRIDGWASWYFGVMIGFGLTLYLIAAFRPVYLPVFAPVASFPVLGLVAITALPLFFLTFDERNGVPSRLVLSVFATLALLGLYAIPTLTR